MKYIYTIWSILLFNLYGFGQAALWQISSQKIDEKILPAQRMPKKFQTYKVNISQIKKILNKSQATGNSKKVIRLNLPDVNGHLTSYKIFLSNTLSKEIQKQTNIRAYRGYGPKGEIASIVLSPWGIHAGILRPQAPDIVIETASKDQTMALVFEKKFLPPSNFECYTDTPAPEYNLKINRQKISDELLRTYRFAVATTGEYSQYHINLAIDNGIISNDATDDQKKDIVLSAVTVTIDRVNSIYERDFGVSLQLVSTEKNVIFLDPDNDPYDNTDIIAMLNDNTNIINQYIGFDNYDGGHLFSTSNGGISGLGIICGSSKGRSVTGLNNPIGDAYDIDYVSHEIGHAFNCNHTFANSCNNNRNLATSVEPGSASTIMGYAGVCSPNIQIHSDDYFSVVSIAEAGDFITNQATCSINTQIGNHAPTIQLVDYGETYIPKDTPFMLSASAQDIDDDALTYCWEQIDPVNDSSIDFWEPSATHTGGPEFRSYTPTSLPIRYFPIMANIIDNTYQNTWEVLPSVSRSMSFAVTVRDNHPGGGQSPYTQISFNIDPNSGPFRVTNLSNDATWQAESIQTVTWDVAGTDGIPVNCATVDILLSADNGVTFPYILNQDVPNNGSAQFTVPNNITTSLGRLMVKAHNNYFFDVAKGQFSLQSTNNVNASEFKFLKIYPNPTKNTIHLSFEVPNINDPLSITLWDISGRLILQKTYQATKNFENTFDLSPYKKGLYFIKIENGTHKTIKKIVLK